LLPEFKSNQKRKQQHNYCKLEVSPLQIPIWLAIRLINAPSLFSKVQAQRENVSSAAEVSFMVGANVARL